MKLALKAIAISALYLGLSMQVSSPALAAPVDQVLSACDKMAASGGNCGYSINEKNGDITGCTSNSCFYCPNDGKRECIAVREAPKAPRAAVNNGVRKLLTK
jgi:hypothetical protein